MHCHVLKITNKGKFEIFGLLGQFVSFLIGTKWLVPVKRIQLYLYFYIQFWENILNKQ